MGQAGFENRSPHAAVRRGRRGSSVGRSRGHGHRDGDRCAFALLPESIRGQLSTHAVYRVHAAAAHAISTALHFAAANALLSSHAFLSSADTGLPEPSRVLHQSVAALHSGEPVATVRCGESEPSNAGQPELYTHSTYGNAANNTGHNSER